MHSIFITTADACVYATGSGILPIDSRRVSEGGKGGFAATSPHRYSINAGRAISHAVPLCVRWTRGNGFRLCDVGDDASGNQQQPVLSSASQRRIAIVITVIVAITYRLRSPNSAEMHTHRRTHTRTHTHMRTYAGSRAESRNWPWTNERLSPPAASQSHRPQQRQWAPWAGWRGRWRAGLQAGRASQGRTGRLLGECLFAAVDNRAPCAPQWPGHRGQSRGAQSDSGHSSGSRRRRTRPRRPRPIAAAQHRTSRR